MDKSSYTPEEQAQRSMAFRRKYQKAVDASASITTGYDADSDYIWLNAHIGFSRTLVRMRNPLPELVAELVPQPVEDF